jgi:2-iminobutanoate/2-iminopropanoate deaminase
MKELKTDKAPLPLGPYSQAIEVNGTIYISGQIGLDPTTSKMKNTISEQTFQVFENISEILKVAGIGFSDIVKVTVFLKDLDDFSIVNGIYSQYFSSPYPARSCVEVSNLPAGALLEIEMIGVLK